MKNKEKIAFETSATMSSCEVYSKEIYLKLTEHEKNLFLAWLLYSFSYTVYVPVEKNFWQPAGLN